MSKQRSILEVWDYRLSQAQPLIYRGQIPSDDDGDGHFVLTPHENWVACIYSQGDANKPLEIHDTGVPATEGTVHDGPGLDAAYSFLRSVRDKYSRDEIEDLKPVVAKIREADKLRQAATDEYNEKLREIKQMGDKS